MPLRRVALYRFAVRNRFAIRAALFAVLACVTVTAGAPRCFAQLVVLHHRSQEMRSQESGTEKLYPRRDIRPMSVTHSFEITPTTPDSFDVSARSGPFDYIATIHNLSKTEPVTMKFVRVQDLPCGWTSMVCFGINCYAAEDSSKSCEFAPDTTMDLIVHLYSNVDTLPHSSLVYITLVAETGNPGDTIQIPIRARYTPPENLRLHQWPLATFTKTFVNPKKQIAISGTLANKTCDPVTYHFTMDPVIPAGWTWKYCVHRDNPDNDPNISTDTCLNERVLDYTFAPVGDVNVWDQHKFTFSVVVPDTFTVKDSAVFNLSVHSLSVARDTGTYRFSIVAQPAARSVAESPALRAGIAVVNAWPNPLTANSKLNIDVMTDKTASCEAHIYDISGIEKAAFDLGDLTMGSNRLSITGLNLSSGEYIMRLEQDGALSGPVRLNIIR